MPDVTTIDVRLLTGAAIAEVLDELATLRLTIFEEYPYLYRGRREDELAYLRGYAAAPEACALLTRAGDAVIGALTGMPLLQEDAPLRDAFAGSTFNLEDIYYVGELLFFPAWRNAGLGQSLLAQLASHLRRRGRYRTLTCATVERPEDHPRRPTDYLPIDRFLARAGFTRLPGITATFTWRETDRVKRAHVMQFWGKELTGCAGRELE